MSMTYIFTTAFLVALSGALMPGPLLTVTITETVKRGFIAGPLLILGHAILEGVLVILLALGLGAFLAMPVASKVIAIVGGVFLLGMGFQMARDAAAGRVELKMAGGDEITAGDSKSMHPVWAGILVSLSNPYWSLWWATIGLGYITMSLKQGTMGMVSFYSGHILADLSWYCLVAAGVAGGRRFVGPRVYRGVIVACGVFLVFLGGGFAYYGFFSV